MNAEEYDEQMRDYVRRLFGDADRPPADVVPGEGPTRADYLRWNGATGKPSTGTRPGEVLLDPDGIPIGVGPSTEQTVIFGGVAVTRSELARVDLTPEDVPNLHLLPEPNNERNE